MEIKIHFYQREVASHAIQKQSVELAAAWSVPSCLYRMCFVHNVCLGLNLIWRNLHSDSLVYIVLSCCTDFIIVLLH